MSSITINASTYFTITTAFVGGAGAALVGVYYALPPYGKPPYVGARNFDEMPIKFPGVNVTYIKRMGSFARAIHVDLIVIGNSLASMESQRQNVYDNAEQLARYDIVFPGGTTFHGCRLVPGGMVCTAEFYPSASFSCLLSCDFIQISETN